MPALRPASQAGPMRNPRMVCDVSLLRDLPLFREVCRAKGGIGSGETLWHDIYPARPITTASENVIVELLKIKCLSCLYYGLEACPLIQSQLRSLEFAVNFNSAFRKIFSIKSYDVVSDCVNYCNCSVSNSI